MELVFYQYDSSTCLVSLNGETHLLVDRADVTDLAELVAELERNVRITDGIFKFVTVKLAEEVEGA